MRRHARGAHRPGKIEQIDGASVGAADHALPADEEHVRHSMQELANAMLRRTHFPSHLNYRSDDAISVA
jgi:hypothetical protein